MNGRSLGSLPLQKAASVAQLIAMTRPNGLHNPFPLSLTMPPV